MIPRGVSEVCREFLEHSLQVDPKKRATINQLLQMKFITSNSPPRTCLQCMSFILLAVRVDPELIDAGLEDSPQVRSSFFHSESSVGGEPNVSRFAGNQLSLKESDSRDRDLG